MKTSRSTYNGKPLIILNPGGRYPFQFGPEKARMILECIEEIKAFVAEQGKPAPKSRLVLSVIDGSWYAEEMQEPRRAEVNRLMGSPKIVTPFLGSVPGEQVKAKLQELNPGAEITIAASAEVAERFQAARGRAL